MHYAIYAEPEFALVVLHVIVLGICTLRLCRFVIRDLWSLVAFLPAIGLSTLGAELFVLGELRILTRLAIYISSAVMLALCAVVKLRWIYSRNENSADLVAIEPDRTGTKWLLVSKLAVAAVFILIFIGCFHPGRSEDETQYHWPSPLLWAHAHGWSASPYRLSNGPALAEMLFTFGALFHNQIVAHMISALAVPIICASVGILARAVGVPPWPAVLAALSIPTFVYVSNQALNDNLLAAFIICAYAAILSGPTVAPSNPAIAVAIILFVTAISVKPFAVLAIPGVALYLLYRAFARGVMPDERRRLLTGWFVLCAAVVLTFAGWSLHCYLRTGKWWETNGVYLATGPSDPMWENPQAAGRHPRLIDVFATPIVFPILSAFNQENGLYGVRIGLLILLFTPLVFLGRRCLPEIGKTRLYFLLGGALIFLVLFSSTSPKTRFHIFVWLAAAVASAVGLYWTQRSSRRWVSQAAYSLFFILFASGVFDAMRHIYSFGYHLMHRL